MLRIFDGKALALAKLNKLTLQVEKLKEKGVTPKLVSILVGDNPASTLYVNLKKKAGEKVGVEVEIIHLPKNEKSEELKNLIDKFNKDESVHGIMVQLPLPKKFSKKERDEIIGRIAKEKDVDGLHHDSFYLTPTVKAILEAVKQANPLSKHSYKVCIVGHKGFEGRKIYRIFKKMGYKVDGADSKTKDLKNKSLKADILISATGKAGLIRGGMVKEGAVVIDVGSPKGDVKTEEAGEKASFISPVPGGVGPVTIACLLENLMQSTIYLSRR